MVQWGDTELSDNSTAAIPKPPPLEAFNIVQLGVASTPEDRMFLIIYLLHKCIGVILKCLLNSNHRVSFLGK